MRTFADITYLPTSIVLRTEPRPPFPRIERIQPAHPAGEVIMSTRASREGSTVPDIELAELRDGKVQRLRTHDLFAGRRVIVFALPGAFTPTCSTAHVPGYVARLADL